jgi:hypothetical protein
MSKKDEALIGLLEVIRQAISSGDWKVDGACDPDLNIALAEQALKPRNYIQEASNVWDTLDTTGQSNLECAREWFIEGYLHGLEG